MPGAGAGLGAARLCLLALALPGWTAGRSGESRTSHQHELVIPQWKSVWPESPRREKHPHRAELRVMAEGRELILDLEKNKQLFAPTYTETHYSAPGRFVRSTLRSENDCFYHGTVRNVARSSVALSTCQGMRGLITLKGNLSYVLEPVPGLQTQHRLYRLDHLPMPKGSCGLPLSPPSTLHWLLPINHTRPRPPPHRVKRDDLHTTKFVELYLVADYLEFQKNRYNLDATKLRLMEIANYADKFYRPLNIRIALVGLEVWTHGDQCKVSANPYSTLSSFLSWRHKLLARIKHDNAQLITGVAFQGITIGLAPLMSMCSMYQSGGVNMDHSENVLGVAATMAHELGHNFGMSHDSENCCPASAEEGGCIMAAATGDPFPKVFNNCNRKDLERYLKSGGGMCLSNMPDTSRMYGGRRCGNGYLEEGEDCDCGEEEECDNPCCNANNCTLKSGAQCAQGACCYQCKLLAPGTLCRKQMRQCDLPEFCTGTSPHCPTNLYQIDGTQCEGGQAYCYNGMCLTYLEQCQQLWGNDAWPAPDLCFEQVNVAGDEFGNCGKDITGAHRKCSMRDAKCGKIQCQSSNSRPLESNIVSIDTSVYIDGKKILCKGTHVYPDPEVADGDILDPGLVMTGTKCGHNHICFEGQCRNTSFLLVEGCQRQCHGRGVCNNNGNCHCDFGWAPPFCETPGFGGSVDSGPLPAKRTGAVVAGVCTAIFLLVALLLLYRYRYRCRNPKLDQLAPWALPATLRQHFRCPFRISQNGSGHANPTFKLQTPQGKRKVTSTPEILHKPIQPPPRPPDYLHSGPPLPPPPLPLSRPTRATSGPRVHIERKESARVPPPSRPVPPAPHCLLAQDFSRPRPPQKALPANPVPGRKNQSRPGGVTVLWPPVTAPQQSQPQAAPVPKLPGYRSQRLNGMTRSKI